MLAAGAREIGAGHLDHRIEPETRDEFGSLVEAFNTMAGELAASQRKLERSRVDLERKNLEVEERRRYIETILERIATGVVSIDAAGRDHDDQQRGAAAARASIAPVVGQRVAEVLRPRGPAAARRAAARGRRRRRSEAAGAGDRARARRARAAPRRRGDAAPGRRRRASKAWCWCSTT